MTVADRIDRQAVRMLDERGPCSAEDLARNLGISVSETLTVVHDLTKRGRVERLRAGGVVLFRPGRAWRPREDDRAAR